MSVQYLTPNRQAPFREVKLLLLFWKDWLSNVRPCTGLLVISQSRQTVRITARWKNICQLWVRRKYFVLWYCRTFLAWEPRHHIAFSPKTWRHGKMSWKWDCFICLRHGPVGTAFLPTWLYRVQMVWIKYRICHFWVGRNYFVFWFCSTSLPWESRHQMPLLRRQAKLCWKYDCCIGLRH